VSAAYRLVGQSVESTDVIFILQYLAKSAGRRRHADAALAGPHGAI
jgi:hypothetical protein